MRPRRYDGRARVMPRSFSALRSMTPSRKMVEVHCWCEAEIITVALEDIRQGKTGSCGRVNCQDPTP